MRSGHRTHFAARHQPTLSSTVINYLTSQSACYGEAPSKIGFNAIAAFPIAIFNGLGLSTRVMQLAVSTLKLTFGATIPSSYQVSDPSSSPQPP